MLDFRLAGPDDRELVENLWAYCFEPKEHPFFRWYFTNMYKPENVLLGFREDNLACLAHLNPYKINVRRTVLPVSYVVGLATHPAARRGGLGGQLLSASLQEMKRRGQGIHILMPSKAGFYQQYGYELYCHQWRETLPLEELRLLTDRSVQYGFVNSTDQWYYLATVYEKYTARLSGYAVRDEASWRRHIDAQLAEGNIAVVFDGAEPIAYAFYQLGEPTIRCSEFVYSAYKGKKGLLGYFYNHRSQGEVLQWNEGLRDQSYRFYPDGKKGHETMPFMTGRIVDVKTALEAIPYDKTVQEKVVFAVKDPIADWNTGVFALSVKDGIGHVERTTDAAAAVTIPVGSLALLVLGAADAGELQFYDKLTVTGKGLDTLQRIFPKTDCYINEWY